MLMRLRQAELGLLEGLPFYEPLRLLLPNLLKGIDCILIGFLKIARRLFLYIYFFSSAASFFFLSSSKRYSSILFFSSLARLTSSVSCIYRTFSTISVSLSLKMLFLIFRSADLRSISSCSSFVCFFSDSRSLNIYSIGEPQLFFLHFLNWTPSSICKTVGLGSLPPRKHFFIEDPRRGPGSNKLTTSFLYYNPFLVQ